ncbi:START domain-containing protein [Vibrio makurazakiensis]|uniref:START domain-containing protein n=1 Tax=Vibrio makurazakiensis TaxID=2910250 RepID=UPI003D0B61ED
MFALLTLIVSFHSTAEQTNPWLFVTSENGITIHKRPHSDGLVEIKAQMQAKTTYSGFLLLLEDSANVPNWIDRVSMSEVLKQLSTNENIVYTQFSAPWPARDRDMVTYSKYELGNGQFELTITDASTYIEKRSGYLRISKVEALWVLQPLNSGTTHITYTAFADPGGILPDWLSNKLSVAGALSTFQGLREQLPKYQNSQHPNLPLEATHLP